MIQTDNEMLLLAKDHSLDSFHFYQMSPFVSQGPTKATLHLVVIIAFSGHVSLSAL